MGKLWQGLEVSVAWVWRFLKSPGLWITAMVLVGLGIITGAVLSFQTYCVGSASPSGWCKVLSDNPPWVLLSGLATVPAVILTWYWREKLKREGIRIAQDGQVTERFTRAIEQLGSDKLPIRLGAIYALERVAKDSEQDHWAIVETLSALLRLRNASSGGIGRHATKEEDNIGLRSEPDVQAVVTVLGRRNHWNDPASCCINLSGTDLSGVDAKSAHFESADLSGADLRGADLSGADLRGANLSGANLSGANLVGVRLERADLARADLSGANLEGACLNGADLSGANLRGADLRGARLKEASLHQADLNEANLHAAYLARAGLQDAKLKGAHLAKTNLRGASLARARLEGANLYEAHLEKAYLGDAHLDGARLYDAHLARADLEGANLEGARLDGADLSGANLSGANLSGANVSGAELSRASGLTRALTMGASNDEETRLPEEFNNLNPNSPAREPGAAAVPMATTDD